MCSFESEVKMCLLCGAAVSHRPGASNSNPWMCKYRALCSIFKHWNSARMISVTSKKEHSKPYEIPRETDFGVDFSLMDIHTRHLNRSHDFPNWVKMHPSKEVYSSDQTYRSQEYAPVWGFLIHESCWNILIEVDDCMGEQSHIQALMDLCRSLPIINERLEWYHDYGGAVDTRGRDNRYYGDLYSFISRVATPRYTFQDPMGEAAKDMINRSALGSEERVTVEDSSKIQLPNVNHDDPFQIFPAEILLNILEYASSNDVASFRCASRTLATLHLPARFWKSRFMHGHELSWLYSLMPPENWKNNYIIAKRLHREPTEPILKNRKRIWELASDIRDAVKLRLDFKHRCPGIQTSDTGEIQKHEKGNWLTAENNLRCMESSFYRGCRLLYEDALAIPNNKSVSEVWISLVCLHGRQYLSGFQFSEHQVGYVNYKNRSLATWRGSPVIPGVIRGFYLALDDTALRGIRVYCEPGGCSDWVGDHEGLPQQALAFNSGSVQRFELGLNALKIVSLSVSNKLNDQSQEDSDYNNKRWAPGRWLSNVPERPLRVIGFENEKLTGSHLEWDTYHYCLFGGPDGRELEGLRHIDFECHSHDVYSWMVSIKFCYRHLIDGDQDFLIFGAPQKKEKHRLELDAQNGEKVVAVDAVYDVKERFMSGLIIYTNAGKRLKVPKDPTPRAPDVEYEIVQLRPEKAIIVGFCSLKDQDRTLASVGLILADPLDAE